MSSILLLTPNLNIFFQPKQPFRKLFIQFAAASQTLELRLKTLSVVVGQNNRQNCKFKVLKYWFGRLIELDLDKVHMLLLVYLGQHIKSISAGFTMHTLFIRKQN